VGLANASSLAGLDRGSARAKLALVADAVRIASAATPDELSRLLDPRAVDIRSAALGRYEKPPERRPGGRPGS
jgi:hypothetical protein